MVPCVDTLESINSRPFVQIDLVMDMCLVIT
jgi:hypothetical protein